MKKILFLLCLGFILIFNITAVAQEKKSYYSIIYGILKDKENESGISQIKTLLDTGNLNATSNYRGSSKMTPLMLAIQYGHDDLAKVLIEAGADVNAKDSSENTALIIASSNDKEKVDVVNALIESKANVNILDEGGNTALMEAARRGHINIIKSLIAAGADVNAKNIYGGTVLIIAIQREKKSSYTESEEEYTTKSLGIINALIAAGADVNANSGNTALIIASSDIYKEKIDIVNTLIEAKSDVNILDEGGTTALMKAAGMGYTNIVKSLIAAGANLNIQRSSDKRTALMMVADDYSDEKIEMAKILIDAGADVNIKDSDGKTALNIATEKGYNNIASMLLEAGADAPF